MTDYIDKRIRECLEYGFPRGANDFGSVLKDTNKKELWKFKNHKGAVDYPDEIVKYVEKEALNKAIVGHFKNNPFSPGIKISPLNSVAKKILVKKESF